MRSSEPARPSPAALLLLLVRQAMFLGLRQWLRNRMNAHIHTPETG
jgi:hypothetical protein